MQHLKSLTTALIFLLAVSACQENEPAPECTTLATVRDLTGLDGCSWVLELEDGRRLEPHLATIGFCGTPPLDPEIEAAISRNAVWYEASPQDGMKVRIAYEVLSEQMSICMVGPVVQVTCLEVLERPQSDQPIR
ncbi:MAG: hypothetical protein WA958_11800 [Tunicatimonas sp.]